MQRPDLATLACVNAECQYFGRPGQGNLATRKVYGKDGIRLLRCCQCREVFSERRNTALFNTSSSNFGDQPVSNWDSSSRPWIMNSIK
jgi:hypothetical protein